MAFDITNLQPIGGTGRRGKSSQLWSYWTTDAHTTVDGSGYLNGGVAYSGAYGMMNIGDVVYVTVWSGTLGSESAGAISAYGPHIVMNRANGQIDLSNVTTGTVTDSD